MRAGHAAFAQDPPLAGKGAPGVFGGDHPPRRTSAEPLSVVES
jgi:hypothetical protein